MFHSFSLGTQESMSRQDCVTQTRLGLHLSLHTWHDDPAVMETLLAGDWLRANTHRGPALSHRHTQNSNLKRTQQFKNCDRHSMTCAPKTTATP